MPTVIVKPANPAPIGVENFHAASVTDSAEGTTFGQMKFISKSLKITLTPGFVEGAIECDDGVDEEVRQIAYVDVSIEAKQIDSASQVFLLGHGADEDAGIVYNKDDDAPYRAIAFDVPLSKGGAKQYFSLFKGKFKEFTREFETKKRDGITYKTNTIEGRFYPLDSNGDIMYSLRSDDDGASATKISNWFTSIQTRGETVTKYSESAAAAAETPAQSGNS